MKLKKECDNLWKDYIKERANYTCELTGISGVQMAAHHIAGKPNYRLRYELRNGICLDNYKMHIWGVHNKNDPAKAFEIQQRIIHHIGEEEWEYLKSLSHGAEKTDLQLVKIYLQQKKEL